MKSLNKITKERKKVKTKKYKICMFCIPSNMPFEKLNETGICEKCGKQRAAAMRRFNGV